MQRTSTGLQHDFMGIIISTLPVHLDHHNCLEVIVPKSNALAIKQPAERLVGTKGSNMKPSTLIPALILTVPLATAMCVFGGDDKPAETPLPTSCTLLSMSPTERTAHLERLKLLKRAATAVAITPEGFSFNLDLQTMPLKELQIWAQAEQSCCSFLKIDSRVVEVEKLAAVRIICPAVEKREVLGSFGLAPQN